MPAPTITHYLSQPTLTPSNKAQHFQLSTRKKMTQNYNTEFKHELNNLTNLNTKKPTLLLHTCCAVCAAGVLGREFALNNKKHKLQDFFNITLYFYNPNINTQKEYFKRANEVKKLLTVGADAHSRPPCQTHTMDGLYDLSSGRSSSPAPTNSPTTNHNQPSPFSLLPSPLIITPHRPFSPYNIAPIAPTDCHSCITHRLQQTANYATSNNFNYFTTTLSVSPHKNSTLINEIGKKIATAKNSDNSNNTLKYLAADFKKEDGFLTANAISNQLGLYRQNYCGCKHN